jgi:hypothetical protein
VSNEFKHYSEEIFKNGKFKTGAVLGSWKMNIKQEETPNREKLNREVLL